MSSEHSRVVRDAPERSRYELVDGEEVVGFADYGLADDVLTLPHVEVDPARRGQSLGAELVRAMLDDARRRGLRVRPLCPFVRVFVRRHPEYEDLVAGP